MARDVLVVVAQPNLLIEKAARNLPQVKVTTSSYLSIADLLKHDKILCLKEVFAQWTRLAAGQSLIEKAVEKEEVVSEADQDAEAAASPAVKPVTQVHTKAKAVKAAEAKPRTRTATKR